MQPNTLTRREYNVKILEKKYVESTTLTRGENPPIMYHLLFQVHIQIKGEKNKNLKSCTGPDFEVMDRLALSYE
jgi:hypothetical protein